jgi:hypothetical protein
MRSTHPPLEGEGRLASREARCETGWGEGLSSSPVSQRFNFSLPRTVQLHIDPFEYRRQVTADLGIPEPDNTISLLLKPKLPFTIASSRLVLVMVSAVEFDDEMCGRAKEIDDIGTDRSLPSKMRAVHRQFFQGTPQCSLVCWRVVVWPLLGGSMLRSYASHSRRDHPTPSRILRSLSSGGASRRPVGAMRADPPPPGEGKWSASAKSEQGKATKSRSAVSCPPPGEGNKAPSFILTRSNEDIARLNAGGLIQAWLH